MSEQEPQQNQSIDIDFINVYIEQLADELQKEQREKIMVQANLTLTQRKLVSSTEKIANLNNTIETLTDRVNQLLPVQERYNLIEYELEDLRTFKKQKDHEDRQKAEAAARRRKSRQTKKLEDA